MTDNLMPIDRNFLLTDLNARLNPSYSSRTATPDVLWVTSMVRDILFEEVAILCRGNQYKAARLLGVNRGTLRTHLRRIQAEKKN